VSSTGLVRSGVIVIVIGRGVPTIEEIPQALGGAPARRFCVAVAGVARAARHRSPSQPRSESIFMAFPTGLAA
jgi:hypothetical protein